MSYYPVHKTAVGGNNIGKLIHNLNQLISSNITFSNGVIIAGDSITANNTGQSATVYEGRNTGYFTVANHIRNSQFVLVRNAGVGGNTSTQLLARIDEDVIAYSPDICVILIGTNDLIPGVAVETITSNLEAMYTKLTNAGIKPILCTIPGCDQFPSEENWNTVNLFISEYARLNKLLLVDFASAMVDVTVTSFPYLGTGYTYDGVHPSALGARLMGQALANILPATTFTNPVPATNNDHTNLHQNTLCAGTGGSIPVGTAPDTFGNSVTPANGDVTHTGSIISKGNYNEFQVVQTNSGSNLGGILIYSGTSTGIVPGQVVSGGIKVRCTAGEGMTTFEARMIFRDVGYVKLFQQNMLYGTMSPVLDSYNQEGDILFPDVVVPAACTLIEFQLYTVGVTYTIGISRPRIRVVG